MKKNRESCKGLIKGLGAQGSSGSGAQGLSPDSAMSWPSALDLALGLALDLALAIDLASDSAPNLVPNLVLGLALVSLDFVPKLGLGWS